VGDIDFLVISAAENSNKFPKTRFWKEKSVEDMVNSTGHTTRDLQRNQKPAQRLLLHFLMLFVVMLFQFLL
jgi:hypothetical protein